MVKQQFSGKNLDDALSEAAKSLGTDRASVSYNILPAAPGGGLFSKLFSRGVRVEAWVESNIDLQAAAREAVLEALSSKPSQNARPQKNASEKPQAPQATQGRGPDKRDRSSNAPRSEKQFDSRNAQNSPRNPRSQQQQGENKNTPNERGPRPEHAPRSERQPRSAGEAGNSNELRERKPQRQPRRATSGIASEGAQSSAGGPERTVLTFDTPGVDELFADYTQRFLKSFDVETGAYEIKKIESGEIQVLVNDDNLEDLLSRSDRLAGAFEHVFKRIAQKKIGDLSGRIFLDAGSAQEQRKERLREMAIAMAEKVKKTGKTITLTAKSSQERRIIHLSLDGYAGVATRSVGVGDNRKLIIFSTDKPQRKPKPEGAQRQPQGAGRGPGGHGGGQRSNAGGRSHSPRPEAHASGYTGPRFGTDVSGAASGESREGAEGVYGAEASGEAGTPRRSRRRRGGRNRNGGGAARAEAGAAGAEGGSASGEPQAVAPEHES